ncbi:hypothetical protein TorRG33x02_176590 [Trema orientale]|uniref:Uncharacterized protein n=1 Tax=Trema orientale TaxID=63057 RepID=A0A2P5EM45_TREOI|nr:hypothetical protein TorRG33x02_176590 [Trema orientale]
MTSVDELLAGIPDQRRYLRRLLVSSSWRGSLQEWATNVRVVHAGRCVSGMEIQCSTSDVRQSFRSPWVTWGLR